MTVTGGAVAQSRDGWPGTWAVAGTLLIAACFVYWQSVLSLPVADDFTYLDRMASGEFFTHWRHGGRGGFVRVLTLGTFYLDTVLWHGSPLAMHLENVLLHGLDAFLVFLLTRELLRTSVDGPAVPTLALGASLLFVIHPSHSEAVSWISGRFDLLATFFSLSYLLLGLRYARCSARRNLHLALCAGALGAALMAKESALAAPIMLIGLVAACGGALEYRTAIRRVGELAAISAVIVGLYLLLRLHWLGSFFESALLRAPALPALEDQLHRLFLPPMEPWPQGRLWLLRAGAAAAVTCLVSTAARWTRDPRESRVFWLRIFGLTLATLGALVPATGLPVHLQDGEGERFLYLATAPLCIAVALVIGCLFPARRLASIALAVAIVAGGWAARAPIERWSEAGSRAAAIVEVIHTESTGSQIAVFDLPDNYEGAFIFRNGLVEALEASNPGSDRFAVDVLSLIDIDRRPVEVELVRHGGDRWRFELLSPQTRFRPEGQSAEYVERGEDRRSFLVSTTDLAPHSDWFVYEGAALRRLEPPRTTEAAAVPAGAVSH